MLAASAEFFLWVSKKVEEIQTHAGGCDGSRKRRWFSLFCVYLLLPTVVSFYREISIDLK